MLEDANSLPTTPAPRTLHKLELETQDPHYDLIGHFVDWKSGDNLTDVALEVDESTLLDCRLHNLAAGATSLFILRGSDGDISIVASGPGESKRAIAFHHRDGEPDENYVRVGALLRKAQSGLRHVESLGIPLGAASDFVSERVFGQALPKLALLNISIEEISELRSNHGWDSLVALLHSVADACPRLESIGVDLQRWLNHPLTADIAHELLAAFEHSMPTLPEISILGFEADTVRDVRIPDMEGCRIRFGGLGDDTVTGRLADREV